MSLKVIDAGLMKSAFISGANNISNNKEYINELNVFPVPDGDTGTNMTLTVMSAVAEINAVTDLTIPNIAKAISGGSLRGARGNSGVILSQIFRGFCREIKNKKTISLEDLAMGFAHAVETAYKAVMKPKEGTILTVARAMSEKAAELLDTEDEIIEFMELIVNAGDEALARTPDLLPVLKEAGVVDSGGQGLMEIMRGILYGLKGQDVELTGAGSEMKLARGAGVLDEIPSIRPKYNMGSGNEEISTADIKYTYCTEFIILLDKELTDKEVEGIKDFLLSIGDSLVCVADEELVKVHVHTNHPGRAFEKGIEYGQLTRCKVDNMREEHSERVSIEAEKKRAMEQDEAFKQIKLERSKAAGTAEPEEPAGPPKKYGFVAVAAGEGLGKIFLETGVDYIIQGGQTMNPSTEDILSAIARVNAENVFILPNNKNIILASTQAASVCEDKNVMVVTTNTIPQGISAMLAFNEAADPETNVKAMVEAGSGVKTGEVTFSIRDTSVDGKEIRKNNIMGISDNGIDVVGTEVDQVVKDLIDVLVDEDSGMVSVYYGEDTTEEEAEALRGYLEEKYEDLEVDIRQGGQPIYYYIVSVE